MRIIWQRDHPPNKTPTTFISPRLYWEGWDHSHMHALSGSNDRSPGNGFPIIPNERSTILKRQGFYDLQYTADTYLNGDFGLIQGGAHLCGNHTRRDEPDRDSLISEVRR